MKERRKPEHPKKSPGDELQKIQDTDTVSLGQP